jgi:hypothetical protein
MRNRCFVLLFCCLLAASANSQQPSQTSPPSPAPTAQSTTPQQSKKSDKIPSGTTAEKAANAVKTPVYTEESFVIEQMHSHYRFEADGTGRKETKARIRVQSEAGVQQWGQLLEGYNSANERVEIPYVRVLKEDGSVVKTGDDAVQDLSAPMKRLSTPTTVRSTSPFPACVPAKSWNTTWSRWFTRRWPPDNSGPNTSSTRATFPWTRPSTWMCPPAAR